jgi:hypothetical protein
MKTWRNATFLERNATFSVMEHNDQIEGKLAEGDQENIAFNL